MTVNATVRVIDVGTVELNDLILSSTVVDLAEMQNDVYQNSRSMVWSFVESSGSGYFFRDPTSAFVFTVDVPEGIDKIGFTTRGTDIELLFTDFPAGATLATHAHAAAEDTIASVAAVPAGLLTVFITVSIPGYLRYGESAWAATTLP
jgi:hypothetical protein